MQHSAQIPAGTCHVTVQVKFT